jgi:hypothetical protein
LTTVRKRKFTFPIEGYVRVAPLQLDEDSRARLNKLLRDVAFVAACAERDDFLGVVRRAGRCDGRAARARVRCRRERPGPRRSPSS